MDVFKKIEINLPFVEALNQMPNYAKFLKDILSKKRSFVEKGLVNLTATCSVVIQRILLEKMQDPGSFTIPCTARNFEFEKALCDSKASINLSQVYGSSFEKCLENLETLLQRWQDRNLALNCE